MGSVSAGIIIVALAAAFFPMWTGSAGTGARKLSEKVNLAVPKRRTRRSEGEVSEDTEESSAEEGSDKVGDMNVEENEVEVKKGAGHRGFGGFRAGLPAGGSRGKEL